MRKLIIASVLFFNFSLIQAQSDSTRTLFSKMPATLKWQWNESYDYYHFRAGVLLGTSTDLVGMVYKSKLHLALGIEEATNNIYFNPYYFHPNTYEGINFHTGYYLMAEPIFWPHSLCFVSVPVKFMYYQNLTGQKENFADGFTIEPGINAGINLFKPVALGIGANYRIGLTTLFSSEPSTVFTNNTFTFLMFLRITI